VHEVEQVIEPAARIGRRPTVKLGLHPRYPRPRPLRDAITGTAIRRRVLRHCSLLPFSIPLPPFPMCRAFPGPEYYGGSAPPGPFSGRRAYPGQHAGCQLAGNQHRMVPVFTVIRSTKEEPGSVPAASPRLPRSASPRPPGQPPKASLEVPRPSGRVRTAPGPYPPDLSRSTLKRRKRRFLAYSFPSRSPGPLHLAVLPRPGFVRAACHPPRHHPGQAAPSSTPLLRQGRR
jgi:hypothetical protein